MSEESFIPQTLQGLRESLGRIPAPQEAFDLFCIPVRVSPARREAEVLDRGERFQYTYDSETIRCWRWGTGPVILLSHGWSSRAASLTAFVDPLLDAGFTVVAQDHVAHGDSDGAWCTGLRVAESLFELEKAAGPFFGAVTHSFGSIGLNIFLKEGGSMESVVHLAPFCWVERRFHEYARAAGMSQGQEAEFMEITEQFFGPGRLASIAGVRIAPFMKAKALVLHDTEDLDIPVTDGRALAAAWPGAKFIETSGLGHMRILRDRRVVGATTAFLSGKEPEFERRS